MWEVFLPIYIYQPLEQSTSKLPYGEPLVWKIRRVVNYIFFFSRRRRRAAQPGHPHCFSAIGKYPTQHSCSIYLLRFSEPCPFRAAAVRCWRGEGSPAQSDPILLFGPVFMFASVFSRC